MRDREECQWPHSTEECVKALKTDRKETNPRPALLEATGRLQRCAMFVTIPCICAAFVDANELFVFKYLRFSCSASLLQLLVLNGHRRSALSLSSLLISQSHPKGLSSVVFTRSGVSLFDLSGPGSLLMLLTAAEWTELLALLLYHGCVRS